MAANTTSSVPKNWHRVRLGDLGDTLGGLTGKTKKDFGSGRPFVPYMNVFRNSHLDKDSTNLVDIKEGERQNQIRHGDYIFTTSSETPEEVGMSSAVVSDPGGLYLNSFCFIFRPEKDLLDPTFGGYLFRGPVFRKEIAAHAKGSTRFNLSKHDFLSVEIFFPESKLEQNKIAEILSSVDSAIRKTDEIINAVEKLKKGLMHELLTRGIGHTKFKKTKIGGVPEEWLIKKLGELATITRGGSPRPIDSYITEANDGLNWLKIGDIEPRAKYITSTGQKIKKEGLSKTTIVNSGDFILSNSMSFGRPYIMKISACIHDGWLAFKNVKTELVSKEFLYYLLSSDLLQKNFISISAGSGVKNLKKETVSNVLVSLPLVEEQNKIAEILSAVDEKISINQKLKAKLGLLKKGLMQDLLSGRTRVTKI